MEWYIGKNEHVLVYEGELPLLSKVINKLIVNTGLEIQFENFQGKEMTKYKIIPDEPIGNIYASEFEGKVGFEYFQIVYQ